MNAKKATCGCPLSDIVTDFSSQIGRNKKFLKHSDIAKELGTVNERWFEELTAKKQQQRRNDVSVLQLSAISPGIRLLPDLQSSKYCTGYSEVHLTPVCDQPYSQMHSQSPLAAWLPPSVGDSPVLAPKIAPVRTHLSQSEFVQSLGVMNESGLSWSSSMATPPDQCLDPTDNLTITPEEKNSQKDVHRALFTPDHREDLELGLLFTPSRCKTSSKDVNETHIDKLLTDNGSECFEIFPETISPKFKRKLSEHSDTKDDSKLSISDIEEDYSLTLFSQDSHSKESESDAPCGKETVIDTLAEFFLSQTNSKKRKQAPSRKRKRNLKCDELPDIIGITSTPKNGIPVQSILSTKRNKRKGSHKRVRFVDDNSSLADSEDIKKQKVCDENKWSPVKQKVCDENKRSLVKQKVCDENKRSLVKPKVCDENKRSLVNEVVLIDIGIVKNEALIDTNNTLSNPERTLSNPEIIWNSSDKPGINGNLITMLSPVNSPVRKPDCIDTFSTGNTTYSRVKVKKEISSVHSEDNMSSPPERKEDERLNSTSIDELFSQVSPTALNQMYDEAFLVEGTRTDFKNKNSTKLRNVKPCSNDESLDNTYVDKKQTKIEKVLQCSDGIAKSLVKGEVSTCSGSSYKKSKLKKFLYPTSSQIKISCPTAVYGFDGKSVTGPIQLKEECKVSSGMTDVRKCSDANALINSRSTCSNHAFKSFSDLMKTSDNLNDHVKSNNDEMKNWFGNLFAENRGSISKCSCEPTNGNQAYCRHSTHQLSVNSKADQLSQRLEQLEKREVHPGDFTPEVPQQNEPVTPYVHKVLLSLACTMQQVYHRPRSGCYTRPAPVTTFTSTATIQSATKNDAPVNSSNIVQADSLFELPIAVSSSSLHSLGFNTNLGTPSAIHKNSITDISKMAEYALPVSCSGDSHGGFCTASGKQLDLSIDKLQQAEQLLEENEVMDFSKTSVVNEVGDISVELNTVINECNGSSVDNYTNYHQQEDNLKPDKYMEAGDFGKINAISAKTEFQKCTFSGFHTARGKIISPSISSLKKAQSVFAVDFESNQEDLYLCSHEKGDANDITDFQTADDGSIEPNVSSLQRVQHVMPDDGIMKSATCFETLITTSELCPRLILDSFSIEDTAKSTSLNVNATNSTSMKEVAQKCTSVKGDTTKSTSFDENTMESTSFYGDTKKSALVNGDATESTTVITGTTESMSLHNETTKNTTVIQDTRKSTSVDTEASGSTLVKANVAGSISENGNIVESTSIHGETTSANFEKAVKKSNSDENSMKFVNVEYNKSNSPCKMDLEFGILSKSNLNCHSVPACSFKTARGGDITLNEQHLKKAEKIISEVTDNCHLTDCGDLQSPRKCYVKNAAENGINLNVDTLRNTNSMILECNIGIEKLPTLPSGANSTNPNSHYINPRKDHPRSNFLSKKSKANKKSPRFSGPNVPQGFRQFKPPRTTQKQNHTCLSNITDKIAKTLASNPLQAVQYHSYGDVTNESSNKPMFAHSDRNISHDATKPNPNENDMDLGLINVLFADEMDASQRCVTSLKSSSVEPNIQSRMSHLDQIVPETYSHKSLQNGERETASSINVDTETSDNCLEQNKNENLILSENEQTLASINENDADVHIIGSSDLSNITHCSFALQSASVKQISVLDSALKQARTTFCETEADGTSLFQTASGKKVPVSESALKQVRNMFCETETDGTSPFQTASGKKVPVSESALKQARTTFCETETDGTSLFQTASGKKVPVSESALKQARTTFCETEEDGTSLFQTASGKKVPVSESALKQVRNMFCETETDGTSLFQTASGKKVPVSESALKQARTTFCETETDGTSLFQTASGKKVPVSESALKQARTTFCETETDSTSLFQTASGKKVPVSESALKQARTTFCETDGTSLFQTASDKKVPVSKSALKQARTTFCETETDDTSLFQTASGRKIPVSESALKQVRTTFCETETDGTSLFQTASGRKVPVSKSALKQVRTTFCERETDDTSLFQTASGKKVPVSESALKRVRTTFCETDDTSLFQTASGKKVPVSESALKRVRTTFCETDDTSLFQTASGKKVPVSESALKQTRTTFCETDTDDTSLFQTASGKKVPVSESALKRVRTTFCETDDTSLFQTASGKKVSVSESALKQARTTFCETETDDTSLFQTASGKKVPVSESALKRARTTFCETETDDTSLFQTSLGEKVPVSESALKQARTTFCETETDDTSLFQTASGKKVSVSESALKQTRTTFCETETDDTSLFQTSLGEKVPVSESALKQARTTFCETETDDTSLFQTASGKKVPVSESALKRARTTFCETETDGTSLFQTASGKKVPVSESALKQARTTFCETETDDTSLFQTASGKKVPVSESALKRARTTFCETETDGTSLFQTASGKKVPVLESVLKQAKTTFCETETETETETDKTSLFQTASGKKVLVSENALEQVRNISYETETDGTSLFQTASGRKVPVSESALKRVRTTFCDKETDSTNLFQTASVHPIDKHISTKILNTNDLRDSCTTKKGDYSLQTLSCVSHHIAVEDDFGNLDGSFNDEIMLLECANATQIERKPGVPEQQPPQYHAGGVILEHEAAEASNTRTERWSTHRKALHSYPEVTILDRKPAQDHTWTSIHCSELSKTQSPTETLDDILSTRGICRVKQLSRTTFHTPYRNGSGAGNSSGNSSNDMPTTLSQVSKTALPIFLPRSSKDFYKLGSDKNTQNNKPCQNLLMNKSVDKNTPSGEDVKFGSNLGQNSEKNYDKNATNTVIKMLSPQKSNSEEFSYISKNLSREFECEFDSQPKDLSVDDLCAENNCAPADESLAEKEEIAWLETLKESQLHQEALINGKKHQSIRPVMGRLYQTKQMSSRLKLENVITADKQVTMSELFSFGVHSATCKVRIATAEQFSFNLCDVYGCRVDHIVVGDGAYLVPNSACKAGKHEIYRAFLTIEGVDPKLVPEVWFCNHYRWVVWKLAAYEISQPDRFGGRCLNPDMIILQLKYRYDREIDRCHRSAVRKIMERDDAASKTMVLCVSAIKSLDIKQPSVSKTTLMSQISLELTDGWYSIHTKLDNPLTDLVRRDKICLGQKLFVSQAEIIGHTEACTPLEAPEALMLKIYANSTRPAPWNSRLGFFVDPCPLCVPICTLCSDGGMVGCIDVVVVRKYPFLYMEKTVDGNCVFRTEQEEMKEQQQFQSKQQDKMEKLYKKIEIDFEKELKQERCITKKRWSRDEVQCLQTGHDLYEAWVTSRHPENLEALCSDEQLQMLYSQRQKVQAENQNRLQTEFQEAWRDCEDSSERKVVPVLKYRVVGCCRRDVDSKTATVITMWRPTSDMSSLDEGRRYKIFNITTSLSRSRYIGHNVQLTANRQTRFMTKSIDENLLDLVYEPREAFTVRDLKRKQLPYSEMDFVGVVIQITQADVQDSRRQDIVYAADHFEDILAIRTWTGLKSLNMDSLTVGKVFCCSSLMDKSAFQSQYLPCVDVCLEFSHFSHSPQNSQQRRAVEKLEATIKSNKHFIERGRQHLAELLERKAMPHKQTPELDQPTSFSHNLLSSIEFSHPITEQAAACFKTPSKDQQPQSSTPVSCARRSSNHSRFQTKIGKLLAYGTPPPLSPLVSPISRTISGAFRPPQVHNRTPTTKQP